MCKTKFSQKQHRKPNETKRNLDGPQRDWKLSEILGPPIMCFVLSYRCRKNHDHSHFYAKQDRIRCRYRDLSPEMMLSYVEFVPRICLGPSSVQPSRYFSRYFKCWRCSRFIIHLVFFTMYPMFRGYYSYSRLSPLFLGLSLESIQPLFFDCFCKTRT